MMMRWLLAIFLILSGGSIAANPVVSAAMAGTILCAESNAGAAGHAAGHSVDLHASHIQAEASHGDHVAPADKPLSIVAFAGLLCCDHGGLSEISLSLVGPTTARPEVPVLHVWSGSSLTELAHPDGLRRPPKG